MNLLGELFDWARIDDARLEPQCQRCQLYRGCRSPKMPPTGEGRKKILVVAEAPGEVEDARGTQLVGPVGQMLRRELAQLGVDLDRDCWKTNALACRPGVDNREPKDQEIEYCRPNVVRAIKIFRPRVVMLFGLAATKSVIGRWWKDSIGHVGRWVGWRIPCPEWPCWICPTWHPSYLARSQDDQGLWLWFRKHLAGALECLKGPPPRRIDRAERVELIFNDCEAKARLRNFIDRGGTVSIDLETDRLRPDTRGASIRSCAVCWEGKETISYPWHGEAIKATSELMRSPNLGKIGYNSKFEQRWAKAILGHGIRNWVWDGMEASHVLDNRPGITGVAFQAFVRLGQRTYGTEVERYLSSQTPDEPNHVWECDLDQLLVYGGIDALVEYELAMLQRAEMEKCDRER